MIKRDITETVYEYDENGQLVKKTVTETHEEDDETRYPTTILNPCNVPIDPEYLKVTCNQGKTTTTTYHYDTPDGGGTCSISSKT